MKPQRFLNHSQIDVYFKQSKDDFVVNEVPLYEFSNEGEHLILKLRKKYFKLNFYYVKRIFSLGTAGFMMGITNSIVTIVSPFVKNKSK